VSLSDRNFSEQTGQQIDAEVRKIIDREHERATEIIRDKRPLLDALVARLLIEETLDQTALEELVQQFTKKPLPPEKTSGSGTILAPEAFPLPASSAPSR